jgi:EpsI family protein
MDQAMRIARRDMIVGLLCASAAGAAVAARPRDAVALIGDDALDAMVPKRIGAFEDGDASGLVVPQSDNSLAAQIYNQTLGRVYVGPEGQAVMLLIAYGKTQNDSLQLHRPEVCYPAFGFAITRTAPVTVPIAPGVEIAARALTAEVEGRKEHILYWTRIGEYLPSTGSEQRMAKLRAQLSGVIPDGVLVRISNTVEDEDAALALNRAFAREMMAAIRPAARSGLIGTANARRMA